MKIYLTCPVRNATPEQVQALEDYVSMLEANGNTVHLPHRDVEQDDPTGGWNICCAHLKAMQECDRVDIFYDETSGGSKFDLGMAWALGKPVYLVDVFVDDGGAAKSYLKVVKIWQCVEFTEDPA